jgi:hypothetical protein
MYEKETSSEMLNICFLCKQQQSVLMAIAEVNCKKTETYSYSVARNLTIKTALMMAKEFSSKIYSESWQIK